MIPAKQPCRRWIRAASSFALPILLLWVLIVSAQGAPQSLMAKQEVPNNSLKPAPPEQPIPYSHKTHLALGLNCAFCHTNPAPGTLMTFPATSKCMTCHSKIATDKPAIQKLTEYSESGKPIPWVRVYMLRQGLRWSHRQHLDAGKKCIACHGDVAQMDRMAEITSTTTMFSCLSCHQKNQAKVACNTCHVWP
jgi:hypothetical protein